MGRVVEDKKITVVVKTTTRAESVNEFPDWVVAKALLKCIDEDKLRKELTFECGLVGVSVEVDEPEEEEEEVDEPEEEEEN